MVNRALIAALVGSLLTPREVPAQAPTALLARPVRVYAEYETDGPLNRPGGILLVDGALWVLDTRNNRIVVVEGGRQGRSIGRDGFAPGEFRWPTVLEHAPDGHVAVWDRALRRVTILDRKGNVVETRALNATEPGREPLVVLPTTAGFLRTDGRNAH